MGDVQLGLFASERESTLARAHDQLRGVAASLPSTVRFGTSSWAFPGWRGIVYSQAQSQGELSREGLREYSQHPLLRTVEIDRSYYAPIPDEDFARYALQVPAGFVFCVKAPAAVTSATLPGSVQAPQANPSFLSADRLREEVLAPMEKHFGEGAGPVVLQFSPQPARFRLMPRVFEDRLDGFLEKLPRSFRYAVEVRSRQWLTPGYAGILARRGVAHVFSFWSGLPMLEEQEQLAPLLSGGFAMIRLMLPPGMQYEGQREAFRPFDRIQSEQPEMRRQVLGLLRKAVAADRESFLIVNNKAEGSAPLTIIEIAQMLASRWDGGATGEGADVPTEIPPLAG